MQCGPSDSWPVVLVPIGGPGDDGLGVDDDDAALDGDREAVQAPRRGAALLLADPVVLRAVARALEPLRRLAPRHPAAQVHALLVEGDDALLVALEHGGVGGDALGLGRRASFGYGLM